MAARPQLLFACTFTQAWPGSMLISSTAGPSSVGSAFQMRLPSLFSLSRFGIAAVIAQDFLRPIAGRKLQQENLRAIQGAIGARRHPHLGQELAVEHRFRFKAGAEADFGHLVLPRQQFAAPPA